MIFSDIAGVVIHTSPSGDLFLILNSGPASMVYTSPGTLVINIFPSEATGELRKNSDLPIFSR